ncbi:insulinase family protein [Pelagicoccus sp. SDUM812003]|uniref:M16 family metallopeptidase n=1 Tax=Pelagicoccus sp. SDUM812003 TaxID=3041267 RepID=UPI00280F968F|nr:insulinase family protein [Pelagicoccus sp. SDUM812003]MDQ8202423.1 insulinase family protein [Pelagicoccus sp. SDUM812003]
MHRTPFTQFLPTILLTPILLILTSLSVADAAERSPWPMLPTDLSPPEGQIWGELENGFRYAIVPGSLDRPHISVRLVVGAGLAHETSDQRGAAFLLQEMASRSTPHFDRDELLAYLLENGMQAQDKPARVAELFHSVYAFDLFNPRSGSVTGAMRYLQDVAGNMSFDSAAFESGKRALRDEASRLGDRLKTPDGVTESLLYQKSPYGSMGDDYLLEALDRLTLEKVEAYWKRLYRPDNMTLYITGNIDSTAVDELVRERFSGLVGSVDGAKSTDKSGGKLRSSGDLEVVWANDAFASVAASYVSEPVDLYQPGVERRYWALDFLGRYAQSLADNSKTFTRDAVSLFRDRMVVSLTGRTSVMQLQERLISIDKAVHRVHEYGILPQDLAERKASYLALIDGYDLELSRRDTAGLLADRLVLCQTSRVPFRSGEALEAYIRSVISALSVEEVKTLSRDVFNVKRMHYLIEIPKALGLSERVISKRLKSMRKGYDFTWAQAGEIDMDWGLSSGFTESGMVESSSRIELGKYSGFQYVFKNKLRLNIVETDTFPGKFWIRVSIGNGLSGLEQVTPGFDSLVRDVLPNMKIGQGPQAPDLVEVLESKGMTSIDSGVNLEQLYWTARGSKPEHVFEFLSALTIWMVTGTIEEEDFDKRLESVVSVATRDSNLGYFSKMDEALFGSDSRLRRSFSKEEIESFSYTEFKDWLKSVRETGYLELTVVGDISSRTVLRDVRKTLGSAPDRSGKVIQPRHGKPAVLPEPGVQRIEYDSLGERSVATVMWPIPYSDTCDDEVIRSVLKLLFAEHVERFAEAHAKEIASSSVEALGHRMVPGSSAVRLELTSSDASLERLNELALEAGAGFSEFVSERLLEAAVRSFWVGKQHILDSDTLLVALFDQSQGKPSAFKCSMEQIKSVPRASFAAFQALIDRVFAEENARVVLLESK